MRTSSSPDPSGLQTSKPLWELQGSLMLVLTPDGDTQVSHALEQWAEQLREQSRGSIAISRRSPATSAPFPSSLALQAGSGSTIFYHFVPRGAEERAFRDLLREASSVNREAPIQRGEGTQVAGNPLELCLFVSNECPNCPGAVRFLNSLALVAPCLNLHLFEVTQASVLATRHEVKSVPTLLVDSRLRFVGDLPRERLSSLLHGQNPAALLREQIRQYIQGGKAPEAARLIIEESGPDFLAEDLLKSTFQERIGLLLVLEEALEIDPKGLTPLVKKLLPGLESQDASLRGDLADLLGRIGHPDALPALRKLSRDQNPDVAEAALEAAETILRMNG